ncbi:MAG: DUF4253 domain-containing protein [Anaerolineales bacterium]
MDIGREYDSAIEIIREYYDGPIRPYMTVEFGRRKKQGAISLIISYSREMNPRKLVDILQDKLPDQYIAFLGNDKWLGEEKNNYPEIVIAIASSQFEAIRLAESRGVNQDVSTEEVIDKLKEYDRKYRIRILRATIEAVSFRLKTLSEDMNAHLDDQAETLKLNTYPREEIISEISKKLIDGFWWD